MSRQHRGQATTVGGCPTCGKLRYPTRSEARKAGRQAGHRRVNAYQCGQWWHLGHLPWTVVQGIAGRDEINPPREAVS